MEFDYMVVTDVLPSGSGFGYARETAEECYLPSRVSEKCRPRVGDVLRARMVQNPNQTRRDEIPLMVVNAVRIDHQEILETLLYYAEGGSDGGLSARRTLESEERLASAGAEESGEIR